MATEENNTFYTALYNKLFRNDELDYVHSRVDDVINAIEDGINEFSSRGEYSLVEIPEVEDEEYTLEELFVFLTYLMSYKENQMKDETVVLIGSHLEHISEHIHEYNVTDILGVYDVPPYLKHNFPKLIDYEYVIYTGQAHRLYESVPSQVVDQYILDYNVFDGFEEVCYEFGEDIDGYENYVNDMQNRGSVHDDGAHVGLHIKEHYLHHLYFKFTNAMMFNSRFTYDSPRYDAKHARIRYFLKVWSTYLTFDEARKEQFYTTVVKKFEALNWTTVSRLFDAHDEVFKARYADRIDYDFANKYHPYYKENHYIIDAETGMETRTE